MPECCPICGLEIPAELPTPAQCQHLPHEREIAALAQKVTMLDDAIEGWRKSNAALEIYRDWVLDHLASGNVTCECREVDGCERDAVDVLKVGEDSVYALCSKCLKPSHGRDEE